ncbi:MAG: hypothetical protein O3A36_00075 [bacterium]|nr:hypothetical protein [bacterium]
MHNEHARTYINGVTRKDEADRFRFFDKFGISLDPLFTALNRHESGDDLSEEEIGEIEDTLEEYIGAVSGVLSRESHQQKQAIEIQLKNNHPGLLFMHQGEKTADYLQRVKKYFNQSPK